MLSTKKSVANKLVSYDNWLGWTFGGNDLYPSVEEKAAMLLYLVTKNHSFSDGNKRIATTLFLWFLNNNGVLYREDGSKRIADNTLGNDFPDSTKRLYPKGFIDNLKSQILSRDIESMEDDIEKYKCQLLSSIDFWFPLIAQVSKRFVTISCFCETVQSIPMWNHYANSHQGFALEYGFRPTLSKGIENCGIYPVIYDDERIYCPYTTKPIKTRILLSIDNKIIKISIFVVHKQ